MDKKEMKEVLENCSDTQRMVTDGWDSSSKERDYLHNHTVDLVEKVKHNDILFDNKKVSDLTVAELKYIIRQIVSSEIMLKLSNEQVDCIGTKIGVATSSWSDPELNPFETWLQTDKIKGDI